MWSRPARYFVAAVGLFLCGCSDDPGYSVIIGRDAFAYLGHGDYQGEYWPTEDWRTCQPEEVGMNSFALAQAMAYAANTEINTRGIVIIRRGYVVAEAYFRGYTAESRHYSYSVAKSFTSVVVGIAIDKSYLAGLEEKVYLFHPQWQTAETPYLKKQITVEHLLEMTSGLDWDESDYFYNPDSNDAYLMLDQDNTAEYVLAKPVVDTPGTVWNYSTGNSQLLSGVIEVSTGMTVYEFALQHLLEPIGIAGIGWDSDAAGHTITGTGVRATVREYAKFGYLYLKNGLWDGQRIVSSYWVERSRQPVSESVLHYGLHWWRKPALYRYAGSIVPDDIMIAWGIYTQQIFVIPEYDVVIVRVGRDPGSVTDAWDEVTFLTLVLRSAGD